MWVAERDMGNFLLYIVWLFDVYLHSLRRGMETCRGEKSSRMKSITQCSTQAGSPHQLPASAPARDQTCFRLRRGAPATPSTLGASVCLCIPLRSWIMHDSISGVDSTVDIVSSSLPLGCLDGFEAPRKAE